MNSRSTKNGFMRILVTSFLVFLIWQLPSLGIVRYPFMLLGTWFHEMGHGLTALLLGGNFHKLEIYSNGGGVAYTSYSNDLLLPLRIIKALVAAGGLLGPCIFGALIIISAKNYKIARFILASLVFLIVLSILLWIRSIIGISILSIIGVCLVGVLLSKNNSMIQWTLLFLGVQCALSTYLQIDYLFTSTFHRNGQVAISDTQAIANNLFGTHWLWAVIVMCISFYVLLKSFKFYLK